MLLPTLARLAMTRKCCGARGVKNSRLRGFGQPVQGEQQPPRMPAWLGLGARGSTHPFRA